MILRSFADLYYSSKAGKLIAVAFYSPSEGKDKTTGVKIYTIDFPPEYLAPPVQDTPAPAGSYI